MSVTAGLTVPDMPAIVEETIEEHDEEASLNETQSNEGEDGDACSSGTQHAVEEAKEVAGPEVGVVEEAEVAEAEVAVVTHTTCYFGDRLLHRVKSKQCTQVIGDLTMCSGPGHSQSRCIEGEQRGPHYYHKACYWEYYKVSTTSHAHEHPHNKCMGHSRVMHDTHDTCLIHTIPA
jgi:hypothetical protein